MKISLNWLKEYVHIDCTPEQLAESLTTLGIEIEGIERPGDDVKGVYVGQIVSIEKHPEADKIVVCKTDVGQGEALQICCGATNMKVGDKVPTAIDGSVLPGNFVIAKRKMRGVESHGMMCSGRELGIGEDHAGLLILPTDAPIGTDVRTLLGLDDAIFDIEVTPNRADWASMIGVAREIAALFGQQLCLPQPAPVESGPSIASLTSVEVEDASRCRRYLGRVIEGIHVGPSPEWLAKRLHAAGQRSINNIVDITNYVLLETGQPLHAFDLDKLAGNRIVVRTAKAGETIQTLDKEQRTLDEEMLVIADAAAPQCVAGVMGGAGSEVGEGTTRIFLESAWFDPRTVRRTSRKLNLSSESSQRFQRGADPEMAAWAIDRAAQLINEIAGGSIAAGRIDAYPVSFTPVQMSLRYARANAFLGSDIPPARQRQHLEGLGFVFIEDDEATATVEVPLRRNDVTREVDLIEEIARLEGFSNLPSTLPRVRAMDQVLAPEDKVAAALRRKLAATGLTEVRNWSFVSAEALGRVLPEEPVVPLANPLSEKQALMRPSLLPSLLENAAYNLNRGAGRLALFELAPTYHPHPKGDEAQPVQRTQLCVLLAGARNRLHWSHGEGAAVDFFDAKGVAEQVLEDLGVQAVFAPVETHALQAGQALEITISGKCIGLLGKVAPSVAKGFDIDKPVYVLTLTLDSLLNTARRAAEAQDISPFPASVRDLAVVVDRDLKAGDLVNSAQKAGGNLLQQVQVLDVYTGKNVAEDKKSVALRLTLQSFDATLTDEKIEKVCSKIIKTLEHNFSASLR